jgi:hypothetical protein
VKHIHRNASYELVIVANPANDRMQCYGVRNLATEVIEAYIPNLATAKHIADEFDLDLRQGLGRDTWADDDDAPIPGEHPL